MTSSSSDIEIYLLKAEPSAILEWLANELGDVEQQQQKGDSHLWTINGMNIVFTPNAEANFGCLWIKQNNTDWATDLDCARSAHAALEREVRCAASEWSESKADEQPGWVKITRGVEKPFDWD